MNRLLKFKDFSKLYESMIFEESPFVPKEKTALRKPFWDSYYENVSKTAPKGTKTKEIIRAGFGNNEGEAEENIKKMFGGVNIEIVSIEKFAPGVVRDGKTLGSNNFYSYLVKDQKNEYWITNNYEETEEGNQVEIGKKDLTPKKLGIEGNLYMSLEELVNILDLQLEETSKLLGLSDNTKEFLRVLVKDVSTKPKNQYDDMEHFFKMGKISESIEISKNFELDPKTLANITNDFGEVLDGIYLLKTIKKIETGLEFPSSESEGLSDIWFDEWNVSSKASKGGGKPSIDALVKSIYIQDPEKQKLGVSFDTPEESDLYNMIQQLGELKGGKGTLPTVESYTLIGQKLIENGKLKDSGFEFMANFLNIRFSTRPIHRKTLITDLVREGRKDPKELQKFFNQYFQKCKSFPSEMFDSNAFIKMPKKLEGAVYYPMAVEIARCLNENYSQALVKLINKFLVVKQMYLNINLTNETIEFTSTSSDTISDAKFMARGSSKTFNAGLAYEMKK
jgi:hypothetical protein